MRGTIDGLVLRGVDVGESDRLLTVLTAEQGKILIRAKGARSMKSKSLALSRPFTYANFEYYEKGGGRWLAGGSINDNFFGISSDIETLALASYIADIASEVSGEGVGAQDILRATLNALYAIERHLRPLAIIKGAFELYAAFHSGFEPDLSSCECGRAGGGSFYLDVMNGAIVCSECMSARGAGHITPPEVDVYLARNIFLPISASVLAALRYVEGASPARLFSFELKDREDMLDFSRVGETYLQNHLERGFDTLNFYKSVSSE